MSEKTPVKLTIHSLQANGACSLSGKEGEVLIVTFDDGTVRERPLSQKSLMQLLRMKVGQPVAKAVPVAEAEAAKANGAK